MEFNINNSEKTYIIPGFKGVMDLDLTRVHKKHHADLIKQHIKDIHDYKLEQAIMKPRLRYENTILKAMQVHKLDEHAAKMRSAQEKERIAKRDKDCYDRYCRSLILKEVASVNEKI
tara:strand:+ start:469 stop:819 length:351 start_codon:yes stop_codon:yes gene_type:complete